MTDRKPVYAPPNEGASFWSLGGRFTVKLEDEAADGRYSVVEAVAWHSTEPPLHIHHREDEAWYILDGQMTFYVGDDAFVAPREPSSWRPWASRTLSPSTSSRHGFW